MAAAGIIIIAATFACQDDSSAYFSWRGAGRTGRPFLSGTPCRMTRTLFLTSSPLKSSHPAAGSWMP